MQFTKIDEAVRAIAAGRMVVVVDDEDRENEGDLLVAADLVEPEHIAFMMNHGRGLVCISLPGERLDQLDIPLMVKQNSDIHCTAFTVTVDYKFATSTGISAHDRAATIRALVNPDARANDFSRPGHMFPLRANPDGVLGRPGHTEAAIDLTRLAKRTPGGVICEIARNDGRMARGEDLDAFARQHGLPIITIESLISYMRERSDERHDVAA